MAALPALYEPMLERDEKAIRAAARELAREEGLDALYLSVARFAILAYAPSQNAKHAVTSVLAAHELREEAGERWLDLIIECAIYASNGRQPWSEPPILDPPPMGDSQRGDLDELRESIAARDRLRAERWLAKRIDDDDLGRDLIVVASEDDSEFGHKPIMTSAALRLSRILGDKGRFATLRIAVWEMVAYQGERPVRSRDVRELVEKAIAENGSFEAVHDVFLFEALHGRDGGRVIRDAPVYPLERDFSQLLEAHMVAKRLAPQFPDLPYDAFLGAVKRNLEQWAAE